MAAGGRPEPEPGRWWPAAVPGGAHLHQLRMDEWMSALPRYNFREDFKPDDETPEGRLRNYRLVCRMIDSHVEHDVPVFPDGRPQWAPAGFQHLSGEEVLSVNGVFYRFEMHHRRPPACLGVDCTVQYEEHDVHDCVDCDGPYLRTQHRCAFTLEHATDGVALMLKEYDEHVTAMRDYATKSMLDCEPLPRDWSIDSRELLGHARVSRWRAPKVEPYADGVYGRDWRDWRGPLNTAPSVPFDGDFHESSTEARHRLVATLCWFRRHQRSLLGPMISAMRKRAMLAALLYERAERMRDAATLVIAARARQPDVLTTLLRDGAGEEFGQALWPYLPPELGTPLMATCKTMHAFGLQHQRRLRLSLTNTCGEHGTWEREVHRIEPDGSMLMLKNRRIHLQPLLEHRFLTHVDLPKDETPCYLLEQRSHKHLTHGGAIDPARSTTRAFLVFDDRQRTPVGCFGSPALRRWDGENCQVGPYLDQTYAYFPKRGLPKITVSANRLSSDFGKHGNTRFRIVVEVSLVHKDSPPDIICDVTHVAETPPFRVVARLESPRARSVAPI